MKKINVAIDGTSGVGKSSVADLLAEKYGMIHLDTGAMYRALAWGLARAETSLEDENELKKALETMTVSFDDDRHVLLNGKDVSQDIRTDEISAFTSRIAAKESIRKKMVALQQEIAEHKGYIVDGRDICSVVLPDAEVKLFLSASPEARAQRRYLQNTEMGLKADYETILDSILKRDYQDSHRAISPLKKAEDAVEIDTSHLNIDQVVEKVSELMEACF